MYRAVIVVAILVSVLGGTIAFAGNAAPQAPRSPVTSGLKGDILSGTAGVIGGTVEGGKLKVTDPRVIAGKIINGALVLVGAVFLLITVYAGFLYMTAHGDAEQIKKSLSVLRRAIVGVAIVLLSLAITRFVGYMFSGRPAGEQAFVGIGAASPGAPGAPVTPGGQYKESFGCFVGEVLTFTLIDC